jgi:hypothetical protein
MTEPSTQLAALTELHRLLCDHGVAYWLFGGWAVDFHAGRVTRAHDDIDIAIWEDDRSRLAGLLESTKWRHTPDPDEDGYTCYERGGVRLEVALLALDESGVVHTPLRAGRGEWPVETFGCDVAELLGVRAHVIRREALVADKSVIRGEPPTVAKDRADLLSLAAVRRP